MLHVYLDTRVLPVTFDVIKFLVSATGAAEFSGHDQITLHIVAESFRQESPRDQALSLEAKRARVLNIYFGLAKVFPRVAALEYSEASPRQVMFPCFPPGYRPDDPPRVSYRLDALDAVWQSGLPVQVIRPSNGAMLRTSALRSQGPYMTITLRTSTWDPIRDGNLETWYEAYQKLEKALGFKIYVIPDYDDVCAEQKFKRYGWETCEWISMEADTRLALYSESKINICMAGGITSLMYLLERVPFISFGNLNSKSRISSKRFYEVEKWEIGTQPQWLSVGQYFDWTEAEEVTSDYIVGRTIQVLEEVSQLPN